jgi:hypothetical protein
MQRFSLLTSCVGLLAFENLRAAGKHFRRLLINRILAF